MEKEIGMRLSMNVTLANSEWAFGGLSIREEAIIRTVNFAEAAQILEAFHILLEKYKVKA